MSEVRIGLAGGRTAFKPGEPLSGHAAWRVDQEPTSVEIRLFWYTNGKGTRDVGVIHTMTLAAPRPHDQRDFTLPLPREPYSFSGKLISLAWAVEVAIEPGAHVGRCEFVMSGSGEEVILGREGA